MGYVRPLILLLPLACNAALITNGGFETGSFSGWTQGGDTTYVSVCKTGATFYVSGLICTSNAGTYAAGLGNSTATGTLAQSIATTAGSQYVLSFYLRNDNYSQAANNLFQVAWGGTTIYSATNLANAGYMQMTFSGLKATTSSTNLTFTFENVPGAFFLDDVSVVIASEPATLTIAGTGLIAVWLVGSLRRSRTVRGESQPAKTPETSESLSSGGIHCPEPPSRPEPG